MKGWEKCHLGSIAEVVNGNAFKSQDFCNAPQDNYLPVIKIKNVANGDTNLEEVQYHIYNESLEKYIVQNGDILLALTGNHPEAATQVVGSISRYKFKFNSLLNQRVANIKPIRENCIDKNFLYFLLKITTVQDFLASNSSGSANQANISKTTVEKIPLTIPKTLLEQKAIAAVLSSLDDKIDLLHCQNATLETMAEALFRQWFVVEAKDEWEEGTFGEIVVFYDKQRIPLSKTERNKMKSGPLYPYYGAAQLMDYINNFIFDGDYLLIGEDGTVRTEEGFPILQRTNGKFWINNHAHIIQAIPPYTNDFIYISLLKRNIDEIITGAVQPKISQGNLKALPFRKFPESRVILYNKITVNIFQKIRANQTQIRTLEKLRDTLLPKLMSGEVRVEF